MKKILAIDDNASILDLIKYFLVKNIPDCEVITAMSGKKGIEMATEESPDTILLDILMPGMDGFEVCQKLKNDEHTKHIPILMVSALGENAEYRIKALNTGADAFITKPFNMAEFKALVLVMLRIKQAEDLLRKRNEYLEIFINEIKQNQKKLKTLNSELNLAEEKERRRIAEYIHDVIGQTLSIAHINLSSLASEKLSPIVHKKIRESSEYVNDAIVKSRSLTYDLSPPILYELGLIPAIGWKLDQIKSKHNIETRIQSSEPKLNIKSDFSILLYRIICELLVNIVKHAQASLIEVDVTKDDQFLFVRVIDNGQGFQYHPESKLAEDGGFGLFSISERLDFIQGHLDIESEYEKGTTVKVSIPI